MTEAFKKVDIEAAVERLLQVGLEAKAFADKIKEQVKEVPPIYCERHEAQQLEVDIRKTVAESLPFKRLRIVYQICPVCYNTQSGPDGWLVKAGVPDELLNASLENWKPRDAEEQNILEAVQKFRANRVGFLLLLGKVGTGKSHLAVALLKEWRSGYFTTQSKLLRDLRRTYSERNATDIISKCQRTPFLVIDEIGLSTGGRDEFPMIHEILSFRHSAYKPTVLTGNLYNMEEINAVLGERMADRIKQNAIGRFFNGESHRTILRNDYAKNG